MKSASEAQADVVATFKRLVGDHGRFVVCQLYDYAASRLGELTEWDRANLFREAQKLGAVEDKGAPPGSAKQGASMRFPVKRRSGLPGRKKDRLTVDMFYGKSDEERLRGRSRKTS